MKKGEVIIFPTDTVYGLGALLYDEKAINKIYQIKKRDKNKKLPVLVANINQAIMLGSINGEAKKLIKAFWPGALTVIVKAKFIYSNMRKEGTIALRCPSHPIALELLDKYGPMHVTSLNISGEEPIDDINIIKEKYSNTVKHIYENNDFTNSKVASTVIDLTNKRRIKIVREGEIKKEQIFNALVK